MEGNQQPGCCYFPRRFRIVGLAGIGMVITYAMRTNVGVTVVTILDVGAHRKLGTASAAANLPNVSWDTKMVGLLHSIFYIGFLITQIPGGYLTTVFPSHRILGSSILLSCILNMLLPVGIDSVGYWFTCGVRLLQGFSEGLIYPALYSLFRHWSAVPERSRLGSAVLTGTYAGAVIGFPLGGVITHYIGWQYVYYLHGGLGILWFFLWLFESYEKPAHHPSISELELEYLENSQGYTCIDYENLKIPWKQILTSSPVIALCVCHFARCWMFILLLTNEPFYLNLFNYNLAENGVYSSIPHIFKVLTSALSGYIADFLMRDKMLSLSNVRKLLTCVGFTFEALCLLVLTFLTKGALVLVFLSLGTAVFGFTVSGWQINHLDLSPRHASVLVAVTSAVGTVGSIIAPIIVGELTINQDLQGWRTVFYITAGILVAASVVYGAAGSAERQPWAEPPAHMQLVQKADPLVRRPYKTHLQQVTYRSTDASSSQADDKSQSAESQVVSPNSVDKGTPTSRKRLYEPTEDLKSS